MLEFVCRFDVEFELEIAVGDEFELELEMIKFDVEFKFFGCGIDVEVGIEFAFELELEFEVGTIAGAGGITVESMKARVLVFKVGIGSVSGTGHVLVDIPSLQSSIQ